MRSGSRAVKNALGCVPQRAGGSGRQAWHATAHASGDASSSSSSSYEYTYAGSDGRLKATFEQAFKNGRAAAAAAPAAAAPWGIAYQMAEKNLVWSDDLKARLLQRVAAQQLGLPDEEVEARLQRLLTLLPALRPRLAAMRPATLAALARDVDAVAGRLVQVRAGEGGSKGPARRPRDAGGRRPADKTRARPWASVLPAPSSAQRAAPEARRGACVGPPPARS